MDEVGSVSMVVSGTSRLLISSGSAEPLGCKSRKDKTIRLDAIVLMRDDGIANATFITVFKFNEDRMAGTTFARQVTTTYDITCMRNVVQITFDDRVFRRPIIVKASASIS